MVFDKNSLIAIFNDLDSVYGVFDTSSDEYVSLNIDDGCYVVRNKFYASVSSLITLLRKDNKILVIDFEKKRYKKTNFSNSAETSDKVVNLLTVSPLFTIKGIKNLGDEIAFYRWLSLHNLNTDFDIDGWKIRKNFLIMDYFTMMSICYVENNNKTSDRGFVDKYFVTRNGFIAQYVDARLRDVSYEEIVSGIFASKDEYLDSGNSALKGVRFRVDKTGYLKYSASKTFLNPNYFGFKIVPLFLMSANVEFLYEAMENYYVHITYIKDNLEYRTVVSTFNTDFLMALYDEQTALKVINNSSIELDRGYIRIPDLSLPINDETGVRAVNMARIVDLEFTNEFANNIVNFDVAKIKYAFKYYADKYVSEPPFLYMMYELFIGEKPSLQEDLYNVKAQLEAWFDVNERNGVMAFIENVHSVMLTNKLLFPDYEILIK